MVFATCLIPDLSVDRLVVEHGEHDNQQRDQIGQRRAESQAVEFEGELPRVVGGQRGPARRSPRVMIKMKSNTRMAASSRTSRIGSAALMLSYLYGNVLYESNALLRKLRRGRFLDKVRYMRSA
jgi:hypothetical protein